MRVLWVVNAPIPSAAAAMGIQETGFPSWVEAAHEALRVRGDVDVIVAFPWRGDARVVSVENEVFASFPPVEFGQEDNGIRALENLLRRLGPDLVHIFGTESGHAYAAAQACTRRRVPFTVGLQGMSTAISEHYLSGLPARVSHGFTARDVARRDNVLLQARKYRDRGLVEARTLQLSGSAIGRTSWDRALSQQLNPDLEYFSVPETLRPSFYAHRWSYPDCQPKSIFISQGHYPIKGLHFVLRALPLIIERHPEVQVFVSGRPPRAPGLKGRLKQGRYATYLAALLRRHGLRDRVHFVGVLDEAAMVDRFLRSHVFVSASTVENESNSLSEAKLLGLPVVASFVGGVVDRVDHGRTGYLYQHDAPYMLAHYLDRLFRDSELGARLGRAAREESLHFNDPSRNATSLVQAYNMILGRAMHSPAT